MIIATFKEGVEAITSHPAPQPGQADPVAEGVREDDCQETAGAQEDEASVCAKEGRVAELEDRAGEGGSGTDVWMGQPELVVVMDVGDGEVEGREEEEKRKKRWEVRWGVWWWWW